MSIKELILKYKEGDSLTKLGIISNVITIISAFFAILASQLLTLKFVFDEKTFIVIALYLFGIGLSLLIFYCYLKGLSYLIKEIKSFLVRVAIILVATSSLLLLMVTIWGFILTIE